MKRNREQSPGYSSSDNKIVAAISVVIIIALLVTIIVVMTKKTSPRKDALQKTEEFQGAETKIPSKEKALESHLDYESITDSIAGVAAEEAPDERAYEKFSRSVKEIHEEMLENLSKNLKLGKTEKKKVLHRYSLNHEAYARDYYNQLKGLNKTTRVKGEKSFVTYDTYKSTEEFSNLLGSTMCNLSVNIITFAVGNSKLSEPVSLFLDKPCTYIFSRLLRPIEAKLKEYALIKDYSISKINLENHIRNVISELATVEDDFQVTWNQRYIKELKFWFWDSKADLEVNIKSKVKAGFKLHKFFNLKFNHTTKEIIIILPEPEVLSNEVDFKIIDIENGILVKIDEDKLTEVMVKGRKWSYDKAVEKGLLKDAKKNVRLILKTIFQPIVMTTEQQYTIQIAFKDLTDAAVPILLDNGSRD